MNTPINIRNGYNPIQPTVRQSGESVIYVEVLPDLRLQPYIYCYWELKTKQPIKDPFTYRVVADGCIDIFFEPAQPLESFVMGFCKQYTEFELDNSFHYIGIRFLPTMFPQLFKTDASQLSNRTESLDAVVPPTAKFIAETFAPGQSITAIKPILDTYFLRHLSGISLDADPRLYGAIASIMQKSGVLNVETDIDTGISPRQLRRLFEYYIGDTAKTFSQVVRFQNILRAKPSMQSLRENKLFYDVGYYDQAHFIKEFKNFYGVTPSRAFGR
ncbi:helix-turn-helix domain-containing protein [Parapedobacter tibetensis]|uniref:helix-turn-helix domain-containing protein n=1 Tax=Parapedobacter tibetensis TaxID=2972951 RepID=UPI00214DD96C|nr:helix-turn-helix domain-containing protein [Parapedobacter tibetensis]